MMGVGLIVSRADLESKAKKISELTGKTIRVSYTNGQVYIEMVDGELKNKREFIGDIDQCYLFLEGILSFILLEKDAG